ncbi:MAG TPA: hypothetical protein ENG80_05855 [Nitrospirae bacterium]|nr:hypothetical protein [Nitrospirota bacterium]
MEKVRTTCTYCGTGCNFYLNVKSNKVSRFPRASPWHSAMMLE